jgi:EAL domain-containing protein (putative c-di-GMP-specific phosphodiesterase class I)
MERPAVEPIDEAAMYRAARARLLDKLVALVLENVSFLQRAKEFSFNVQGKTIAPGAALLEDAQQALNDEVLRHLNIALELTMGELVDKLEGARQQAVREMRSPWRSTSACSRGCSPSTSAIPSSRSGT